MEEAAVGSVLADRLVLQREIARGGMGVVFEARHQRLRTQVAVKLLTHETLGDIHVRERLFREAQALAMVGERGVVRVLDCAEDARHGPYVVMEMLRGRPLDGILAARRMIGLADAVRVIDQVAQTLSEVHAHGVVHRDVKPSNLFIVREGRSDTVKLLDFGIALLPKSTPERVKITRSGAICGTPEYMSPEQLFARDVVDARSDVFSLAAVAYECLSGRIPFGSDLRDRAVMHSQGQGAPMLNVLNPAIPVTVARVIDKALSVDPNARFESAQLFAEALKGVAAVPEGSLQLLAPLATQAFAEHPKLRNTDVGVADPTELVIDLVQRRRSPRAPFLTPVRVLAGNNEAFDGRSQDISERGMQVLLHSPLAIGSRVTLKFALPMTGTLIATSAVVRWCRNGRGASHAVGFEFDEAVESGADVIRRYVAWFGESEQA